MKTGFLVSTRPRYILPTIFSTIFIRDSSMRCVLYIKNVQQKFEGIMFGSIYIAGLSILFTQRV